MTLLKYGLDSTKVVHWFSLLSVCSCDEGVFERRLAEFPPNQESSLETARNAKNAEEDVLRHGLGGQSAV
jgi:hypothetical protein